MQGGLIFPRPSVRETALTLSQHSPRRWVLFLPVLVALGGCGDDSYSEAMFYPVRTDPIILATGGREIPEPDRPGQLPLFSLAEMKDDRNPFFGDKDVKFIDTRLTPHGTLSPDDRQELQEVLEEVFGTPAHPKVELITRETRQLLQLDEGTLKEGSRLYRQHCLHCHGLTGDGRGPTSKWVNPHPRDYRLGIFKFQSVDQEDGVTRPPRRDDLYRTLHEGVEGTAMQSYNMLPEDDLNALVSYIIHLSIRGEVEIEVFKNSPEKDGVLQTSRLKNGSIAGYVKGKRNSGGKTRDVVERWREAQDPDKNLLLKIQSWRAAREKELGPGKEIVPGESGDMAALTKSVQSGYEIFVGRGPVSGGCVQCHSDFGRKSSFKFDEWGTMVRPRDLTKQGYRGGRRPVDLYYRIHSGINGSGMLRQGNNLTPMQIWDVVNFVRTLPYPAMRKELDPGIQ
jgi:mono/diheme cytochrome c family protein